MERRYPSVRDAPAGAGGRVRDVCDGPEPKRRARDFAPPAHRRRARAAASYASVVPVLLHELTHQLVRARQQLHDVCSQLNREYKESPKTGYPHTRSHAGSGLSGTGVRSAGTKPVAAALPCCTLVCRTLLGRTRPLQAPTWSSAPAPHFGLDEAAAEATEAMDISASLDGAGEAAKSATASVTTTSGDFCAI